MAAWTSGGSWLLESKHDMISSEKDDGSSPAAKYCRSADRFRNPRSFRFVILGFRLLRTMLQGCQGLRGGQKDYRNEPGMPAPAITDATTFPDGCPARQRVAGRRCRSFETGQRRGSAQWMTQEPRAQSQEPHLTHRPRNAFRPGSQPW